MTVEMTDAILHIVRLLASRRVPSSDALDALREMTAGQALPPIEDIIVELRQQPGSAVAHLCELIKSDDERKILDAVHLARNLGRGLTKFDAVDLGLPDDIPMGWKSIHPSIAAATTSLDAAESSIFEALIQSLSDKSWTEERHQTLDRLLLWPDDRMAPALLKVALDERDEERIRRIFTVRFGETFKRANSNWRAWLEDEHQTVLRGLAVMQEELAPIKNDTQELLIIRNARNASLGDEELARKMPPELRRETPSYSALNLPKPNYVPPPPSAVAMLWSEHIQPLMLANWYLVAGILMMLLGSSLLAYYTWDKHWILRYTILPLILAGFTRFLGLMGRWIESRDQELRGTGATLRGAAIALLPANFMVAALLASDPAVTLRAPAVLLMLAIIFAIFGRSVTRWCDEVHDGLGRVIGRPLLLINLLVLLAPLASQGIASPTATTVAGFYAGFGIVVWSILTFANRVTRGVIAAESRIAWFALIALGVTFLQVFGWVHALLGLAPTATSYAALIVLTGGLVLRGEKTALVIRPEGRREGVESFLGYALILLGVLMGATSARARIITFALAGAVWLMQARSLRSLLHHWIALTLFALSLISISLLPSFPIQHRAWVGLALAIALSLLGLRARKSHDEYLGESSAGLSKAVLFLTCVVAVLAQWRFNLAPLVTAIQLGIMAGLFMLAGWKENRLRWIHTAAVILAMMLPYAGCVDLERRTMEGNTMPFGLAMLSFAWIAVSSIKRADLARRARSTSILFYGTIALGAMLMRVLTEHDMSPKAPWWMDDSGPLLMTAAMACAAWYSRSLLPGIIGVAIAVILFPELRSHIQTLFPWITWGSGLGSSVAALILMIASFRIRAAECWKREHQRDPFLGSGDFPLVRPDHTLYTWPFQVSAVFLATRVDLFLFMKHVVENSMSLKTSAALILTGILWILAAAYHREAKNASRLIPFGACWLFAGIWYWLQCSHPETRWYNRVLVWQAALGASLVIYRLRKTACPWIEEIMARPTRTVLTKTAFVFGVMLLLQMIVEDGARMPRCALELGVLAVLLVQRARETGRNRNGALLFLLLLAAVMDWSTPGSRLLFDRVSARFTLWPVIIFFIAIRIIEEWLVSSGLDEKLRLRAILSPFQKFTTAFTCLAAALAVLSDFSLGDITRSQNAALVILLLAAARACGSGFLVLAAFLQTYVLIHRNIFAEFSHLSSRIEILCSPRRLAAFALVIASAAWVAPMLFDRWPILAGRRRRSNTASSPNLWLPGAAILTAMAAVFRHSFELDLRNAPEQLIAPYLAAATFVICAHHLKNATSLMLAGVSLAIGNIHVIRVFAAPTLYANGLTLNHVISIGLGLSIIQLAAMSRAISSRPSRPSRRVSFLHANLWYAGSMLVILASNYLADPDLTEMSSTRLITSGLLAFLAGLPFRRVSRKPPAGEEELGRIGEAIYHFGLSVSFWCAALLYPPLRTPQFALVALGVPAFFFYARAEFGSRDPESHGDQFRTSSAAICFALLGLYVFRVFFQMLFFPNSVIHLHHYHGNAVFILVVSLVMLRLRALGGTEWLAFYGGGALILSSYFALTALPGLSPFDDPVAGAWCAILLGHFLTTLTHARSPLATGIRMLGKFDDASWTHHRINWGLMLLIGAHAAIGHGFTQMDIQPHEMLPLALGIATLTFHFAVLRRSSLWFVVAGIELIAGLHMDFMAPSYLSADNVVWAIAGIWAIMLAIHQKRADLVSVRACRATVGPLIPLFALHVLLHHGPSSTAGLIAAAVCGVLIALTPTEQREATRLGENILAFLVWLTPVWLVYFGQHEGRTWPALAALLTAVAIASFIAHIRTELAAAYLARPRSQPRIADHALALAARQGLEIHNAVIWIAFSLTLFLQMAHYFRAMSFREFIAAGFIHIAAAFGWHFQGKMKPRMIPYVMLQIAIAAVFALLRRQLMLTTPFWRIEYDVWVSLAVSGCLAGAKEAFDLRPREIRQPLVGAFIILPVVAILWSLLHGMGTRVTILILGVNSLLFAFVGRHERKSPYNFVAIAGFVAFIIMTFWSELGLRVAQAYVVPVGLGVLVLLQLFGDDIDPDARQRIRSSTLITMLGSSGYYALADDRYPVAFHFIMIGLCLGSMALGALIRVRLYLTVGFAALVTDLISLGVKTLAGMERTSRMSAIGALVLTLGATLIGGAVYAKARRNEIDRWLGQWRKKTVGWE